MYEVFHIPTKTTIAFFTSKYSAMSFMDEIVYKSIERNTKNNVEQEKFKMVRDFMEAHDNRHPLIQEAQEIIEDEYMLSIIGLYEHTFSEEVTLTAEQYRKAATTGYVVNNVDICPESNELFASLTFNDEYNALVRLVERALEFDKKFAHLNKCADDIHSNVSVLLARHHIAVYDAIAQARELQDSEQAHLQKAINLTNYYREQNQKWATELAAA